MVLFNIDMPKNCYECPFLIRDSDTGIVACDICNEIVDISEIDKKRSDVCPMKGIKEEQKMTIYIKTLQKLEINNMDELEKFAEFAEKMIRNKILTVDEVRDILGYEEKEDEV